MGDLRRLSRAAVVAGWWPLWAGCGDTENEAPRGSAGMSGAAPTAGTSGAGEAGAGGGVCDCDDGVACTRDECVDSECRHLPLHFECVIGEYCSAEAGCGPGGACAEDADCERPDNCLTATCDAATARCMFAFLDKDGDGQAPESCGGNDCNDDDPELHGDQAEVCDGKDNDCDGATDPEGESSCAEGLLCINRGCRCPVPAILCEAPLGAGQVCVDPSTDPDHCGQCDVACSETEECVNGLCECAPSHDVCGETCVDFDADALNCGECGAYCGDAECVEGGCVCPNGGVDCSATDVPACVATDSDVQHCGGCGERCLDAGACLQGDCDTTVEWLKIFYGQVPAVTGQGAGVIDTDASGNIYVAASAGFASYRAFPDGQNVLFTGPGLIAKFDQNGELQWAEHSSVGLAQLAVVGDDVWVAAYAPLLDSISVAGHLFNSKDNHQAFTAVLKLDAATGDVADFFQLDYLTTQGASDAVLLHDAQEVWLVQAHGASPQLGDTTWTPPGTSSSNTFVYSLAADAPLWLPGYLRDVTLDAAGELVLQLSQGPNTTVNFGGEDLVYGASGGDAVVRLTSELAHDASFSTHFARWMVPGAASLIYVDAYTSPILSQLSVTGEATPLVGPSEFFTAYRARAVPGYIAVHGDTNGGQLAGRSLPFGADALVTYSDSTFTLERALAFHPNGSGGSHGGILDFALVDGGQSALLLVRLHNGLTLKGQSYDIGLGYHGLALLKVNLYSP